MNAQMTDRQQEIVAAAGKLLTMEGVGGLTIKNLAREMQFSESAIYRHFDSKEDILVAMLDYLSEELEQRYERVVSVQRPFEEQLRVLFRSVFTFFDGNPHFAVAVFSDGLMEASDRINQAIFRLIHRMRSRLVPLVREGQHRGAVTSSVSAEDLVHIIMGTIRLQMFRWRSEKFDFDIIQSGDHRIDTLITLIVKK
ncbi:MAG: TetR/AcrR family transcriptional regulator [Saprospiraceae bacterium]|jgi:TetR/AcrR family fatty acid metabolism transcriptional regulator|nr:TetR/AcrR family transcriptional regulator [Saprospiraceae bacterium]MBP9209224.1 TetR/AcrR family transcriptional regulator [Saprospiraceae bacterium]